MNPRTTTKQNEEVNNVWGKPAVLGHSCRKGEYHREERKWTSKPLYYLPVFGVYYRGNIDVQPFLIRKMKTDIPNIVICWSDVQGVMGVLGEFEFDQEAF